MESTKKRIASTAFDESESTKDTLGHQNEIPKKYIMFGTDSPTSVTLRKGASFHLDETSIFSCVYAENGRLNISLSRVCPASIPARIKATADAAQKQASEKAVPEQAMARLSTLKAFCAIAFNTGVSCFAELRSPQTSSTNNKECTSILASIVTLSELWYTELVEFYQQCNTHGQQYNIEVKVKTPLAAHPTEGKQPIELWIHKSRT